MKSKFRITNVSSLVIIMMLGLAVIITTVNLVTTYVEFGGNTEKMLEDYMRDMASTGGEVVHSLYKEYEDQVPQDKWTQYFENMKIEEFPSSYAYVVNLNNKNMVFHPDETKIGSPVSNSVILGLCDDVSSGKKFDKKDYVEYEFKGEIKMAAYSVVADDNYVLVISADKKDISNKVNGIFKKAFFITIVAVLIIVVFVTIVLKKLMKDLEEVKSVVEQLSHFELADNPEQTERLCRKKSEIGDIAIAVRDLKSTLRDTVTILKNNSELLASYSDELSDHSGTVSEFMVSIDSACNDIAEGATSQAHSTEEATHNAINMGELIDVSINAVDELKYVSEEVKKATYSAGDKLAGVTDSNQKVTDVTEKIGISISETSKSAEAIRSAAEIITSIASQTNLLSLNASIEAARAGEAGRGFAVVASEISQLSEQSNQAAAQISEIINELISNSNRSVEDIKEAKLITEEQTERLKEAIVEFNNAKNGLDKSLKEIDKVKSTAKKLDVSKNQVLDIVQSLAAISEENAASTEETASSVTQAKDIIDEVADKANNVSSVAIQLEQDANKWIL